MKKNQILGEILALAISNRVDVMSYLKNNQLDILQILNQLYELELLSENRYKEVNELLAS